MTVGLGDLVERFTVSLLHRFELLIKLGGSSFSFVVFALERYVVCVGLSNALINHPSFRVKELLVELADLISMLGVFLGGSSDHQID